MRDKYQNTDSLSRKIEYYERLKQKKANQAEIREGFSFLDKKTRKALPLMRCLAKSGLTIPGHLELKIEKATEIEILFKNDPFKPDSTGTISYEHEQSLSTRQNGAGHTRGWVIGKGSD